MCTYSKNTAGSSPIIVDVQNCLMVIDPARLKIAIVPMKGLNNSFKKNLWHHNNCIVVTLAALWSALSQFENSYALME